MKSKSVILSMILAGSLYADANGYIIMMKGKGAGKAYGQMAGIAVYKKEMKKSEVESYILKHCKKSNEEDENSPTYYNSCVNTAISYYKTF